MSAYWMLITLLTKDIQRFNTSQCHIIGRFSCLVSSCSVVHPVPPGHLEHEDDEDGEEEEDNHDPGKGGNTSYDNRDHLNLN